MTAVQQRRRTPPPNVRRRGIVYGAECFDVDPETGFIRIDPATGAPRLRIDYVGQSRQRLSAREEQHRDDKPWADLIVRFVILEQGQWLDEELDEREIYWIQQVRPRYNHAYNLGNPERIEIWSPSRQQWRQMEQRWARDTAAGREPWVRLEDREPGRLIPPGTGSSVSTHRLDPRSWKPWQQKAAIWSLAWTASTCVIWAQLTRNDWLPAGRTRLITAAAVTLATWAVSMWSTRRRWRRIARVWRRTVRAVTAALRWLTRIAG